MRQWILLSGLLTVGCQGQPEPVQVVPRTAPPAEIEVKAETDKLVRLRDELELALESEDFVDVCQVTQDAVERWLELAEIRIHLDSSRGQIGHLNSLLELVDESEKRQLSQLDDRGVSGKTLAWQLDIFGRIRKRIRSELQIAMKRQELLEGELTRLNQESETEDGEP